MTVSAQQIRELAAAGHPAHVIAERLGIKHGRVTQTLKRGERRGRPGGTTPLDEQIKYMKRIVDSNGDSIASELAQKLLERLIELESGGSNF